MLGLAVALVVPTLDKGHQLQVEGDINTNPIEEAV
jgi:hypothetical protein